MQEAYEKQCRDVFDALQAMDDRLASRRYLIDNYDDGAPAAVAFAKWVTSVRAHATFRHFPGSVCDPCWAK